MSSHEARNDYLEQVVAQKARLEDDLRAKRKLAPAGAIERRQRAVDTQELRLQTAAASPSAGQAVDYRVTGFWRWKNVIVPPNAYVVHTRRGVKDPLHIGLGISFRFDPVTDSFLVVPAVMQTIIIHANCICRERQGLVVQGYVQWIIDDFATAYRKLDFTDETDPMRVVNVQLREQAEAAIKDKVSTMGIDEVLADKQPIIEELTARLRAVAESHGQEKGLGLRIVTVQIKEAVVCSPRVWEMLQRPFRAERAREARLAELASEAVIRAREAESDKEAARLQVESEMASARLRADASAAEFDRAQSERSRRAALEAETRGQTFELESAQIRSEGELARLRLEQELGLERLRQEAKAREAAEGLGVEERRRKIQNELSPDAVRMALIQRLPEVAANLPKPEHLRAVTVGGDGQLGGLVAGLLALAESLENRRGQP